jgi:hypothetical protein
MNPATGLSKKQLLLVLAIILVSLLVMTVLIVHTSIPNLFHLVFTPNIPYGHP